MPEWFATDTHPDADTLAAYLDGLLVEPEQGAAETHISQCQPCSNLVAEVRQIQVEDVFESKPRILMDAVPHVFSIPASTSSNVLPFHRR